MDDQYTFENKTYRDTYRHTTSHILAQAMKRLYPEVKLAIGPAIEDGFYYDFDSPQPFTPEVLEKLEAEMRKICKEKLRLERFELPRAEALKFMEERDEPYKVELINDLPEDAVISFYRQGEFVDLCAGPHLDSTGRVKGNAIKLTSVTGAYWRGDSSRKMLQRIYGTCFPKKEELDAYLARIEEAKKRDHRKLGKELGLFTFMDEGPASRSSCPTAWCSKTSSSTTGARSIRRPAMSRSRRQSCSIRISGTAAATGITIKIICIRPSSTMCRSRSSR